MTSFQLYNAYKPARGWTRRGAAGLLVAGLAACAVTPPAMIMSNDDRIAIGQISGYMNNLQSFQAQFTQAGPDGVSTGTVWMARPGRLCVLYIQPSPKIMIANHGRLKLVDQRTGAATSLPLSRTPLDILLAPSITLSGEVTITALQRLPGALQLSLVKTAAPGQGTLTLRFGADPLALQGVTILDRNGQTTQFDLHDLQPGVTIAPARFEYTPPAAS